ncbi:hypothetical protein [Rhizobium sp. RU35A]|uniref:hypothetical protein n=1 Tax=Rhizobium sp. RU35A TaxID=1907414 RepID=UPI001FCEFFA7|nr:hypothetical protein [Rhizobium sp. RU35A]
MAGAMNSMEYKTSDIAQVLLDLLGEDDFFRLVEAHAGMRLYIPADPHRSSLPDEIGLSAARKLAGEYRGGYIKVPLARQFRALRYREAGLSNKEVARRLGLTETAVEDIFSKARKDFPDRGKNPKPRGLRQRH